MHRKDDQYSPSLFLDAENDFEVYEIVSGQKSFVRPADRNFEQPRAGAINLARIRPTGRIAPAGSDTKFYKSPQL
jgi:hypothetical protein